jgi:5-methylcytosine-specific restriction endonuclease McrA
MISLLQRFLELLNLTHGKRLNYYEYIKSARWKRKADKRRRRDKFICQHCGARGWQVHHKTYERLGHERMSDLETLCDKCHRRIHR